MIQETIKDLKALLELPEKFEELQTASGLQFSQMQQIIVAMLLMNNGKIEIPRELWHSAKGLKYVEYLGKEKSQAFEVYEDET